MRRSEFKDTLFKLTELQGRLHVGSRLFFSVNYVLTMNEHPEGSNIHSSLLLCRNVHACLCASLWHWALMRPIPDMTKGFCTETTLRYLFKSVALTDDWEFHSRNDRTHDKISFITSDPHSVTRALTSRWRSLQKVARLHSSSFTPSRHIPELLSVKRLPC